VHKPIPQARRSLEIRLSGSCCRGMWEFSAEALHGLPYSKHPGGSELSGYGSGYAVSSAMALYRSLSSSMSVTSSIICVPN